MDSYEKAQYFNIAGLIVGGRGGPGQFFASSDEAVRTWPVIWRAVTDGYIVE
jgi:hypothetical protein